MLQAQCTTSCPNAVRPRQFAFVEGIFTQFSSTIHLFRLAFYAVALAPVSVVEVTFSISIFGMLADALPKSVCLALGFLV